MSGDWADVGNRLYEQGGRQGEAEQAYRQAIAAGDSEAWLSLGNLLYEQEGRQGEAEQAYRQAAAAGSAEAWDNLATLRSGQQGRHGEAEQPYRSGATAGEIQQWPLTAAATALLLALPPSSARKVDQAPAEVVNLALKELIVRGAYRIQVGRPSGFLRLSNVVLLPQQPPPLPWPTLDGELRPHTPGDIASVLTRERRTHGVFLIKRYGLLGWEIGKRAWSELAERGLVEQLKKGGILSSERWGRTASGEAWAQSAEQHVQRLQGLPWEAENDPQTAARAAAAAGALALMVPARSGRGIRSSAVLTPGKATSPGDRRERPLSASLAALARLRRRSRARGGDLDIDFAYVSDGVAFDPFDAVGDLLDSALGGEVEGSDTLESLADSFDRGIDWSLDASHNALFGLSNNTVTTGSGWAGG